MNQLSMEERAKIIGCLVEGCSMRSTTRLTGFAKRTVARFQREIGEACAAFHDKTVRNVACKRVQVDEVWSFTYAKAKNVPERLKAKHGIGDTWTWIGICPDSKLVVAWHVGQRNANDAYWFIHDLKDRLASRIQLTSDGHRSYLEAVESAFGSEIDFAQLIKLYGNEIQTSPEVRYSPAVCTGTRRMVISGMPDPEHVSTSICERQNLTLRMSSRRFTRLTNGFSKKFENHAHAVSLHFVWYNFARVHQTLRVTPAMEAKISDHVWSLEEIAELLN